jgi:hypothetical protein
MWHTDYDALFGKSLRLQLERLERDQKFRRKVTRWTCIGAFLSLTLLVGTSAYGNLTHSNQKPPETQASSPGSGGIFGGIGGLDGSPSNGPAGATPGPAAAIPFVMGLLRRRKNRPRAR